MKRRKKINQKKAKKLFTKTAQKVKSKNNATPMRGGIRL